MTMLSFCTRVICHAARRSVSNLNNFPRKIMENGEPASKKIGTHDGIFHCDEVLACFLLKQLPTYAEAKVIRSRNDSVLKDCDIVVDVGGVFDSSKHRYDHHQRDFNETMDSIKPDLKKKFTIKLSSAGLIYAHFGEQVIRQKTDLPDEAIKVIYEKMYEYFVQEIDAIDNGIMICDGEPKYRITTNLSSRIGTLNPRWNSPPSTKSTETVFEEAMDIVGKEFLETLDYYSNSWWPAKYIVKQSLEKRSSVHSSGKIVELDSFVPWKEHLFDLEKELGLEGDIIYVIYQDKSQWRVICVPNAPNSFICRKFLREEWRGVRDEDLSKISGIPGCVFCHSTGFIGGNATREGALQMAVKSLE
ncbi:MYG1 protein-like isoform X2 [Arctopsyche grandis]|uniref:MYG1 protein-like isoform X2 n=1 Tax=Arctopsyche grandis TaxID=121162 RepID=UPI00406DA1D3